MTITAATTSIDHVLAGTPYVAYCYGYPHKTSYRRLPSATTLTEAWRDEPKQSLCLYIHIPFCEHRCGFCNLFTLAQPDDELARAYLKSLRRQADTTRESLGDFQTARLAFGGGTPTFFTVDELTELLDIVTSTVNGIPHNIPFSCEASPATVTAEKLALLRHHGVQRLSLGIQSFDDNDVHALGRPQGPAIVESALKRIRDAGFPVVNLDLIYGGARQTAVSWQDSLQRAVDFAAEEIFLYPLYVRPLTGLAERGRSWDDWRLMLYRQGRDFLLSSGYEQVSMRMFRRLGTAASDGPVYCCQEDGMIGLGCGARSYTRSLHYSFEYAVHSRAVAGILASYLGRSTEEYSAIGYGFGLNLDEERRRYVIISLLQAEGLARSDFASRFFGDVLEHFPELALLEAHALALIGEDRVQLTMAGLERSDAIGPWLYSHDVRQRMETYTWR